MSDVTEFLNQISDSLAGRASTLEETVSLVSRTTGTVMGSPSLLWLAETERRELTVAGAYDPAAPSAVGTAGRLHGWNGPLHDAVLASRWRGPGHARASGPFVLTGLSWQTTDGSAEETEASGRQSEAAPAVLTAVVLQVGDTTTGVLGVVRPTAIAGDLRPASAGDPHPASAGDPHPASAGGLSELEVALLRQIGGHAALAIDNARLRASVRDPLTGLPNRFLLADHSAGSAAPAGAFTRVSGAERTVLVVDIDRFKEINDTLGHAIGDLVLLEVSRRLDRFGHPVELVARLGSDEFALVARSPGGPAGDEQLAGRILTSLGEPFDVGGVKLRLRASIGIAPGDLDMAGNALDVPVLLGRAEAAMYQAKREHAGIRLYSDDLERRSVLRLVLASELAEAIDHGQLQLDYQPKVSTTDGRVTGVEALVRWQHPTRGMLPPDVFVALAEQTGIIGELTHWILDRALEECASWRRGGFLIPVAVNLSAGTVRDASLVTSVTTSLGRAGLPTEAIEFEITESAVMGDPVGALRTLEALVAEGVRFSLDDFGTGHSSLSYLQRLPVASVKIDKSFVSPLSDTDNTVARAIVTAIIELGHSLGLEVVAEGVDSKAVLDAVTSMGCDAVQGFYIASPMSSDRLRTWIASRPAGEQGPAGEEGPVGKEGPAGEQGPAERSSPAGV